MNLDELSNEDLAKLLEQLKYDTRYNKLAHVDLYDWQKTFINANKDHKQRYLRAGNRCGKTFTEAYDFAIHLTGLYPDWFEGERIPDSGHTFIAAGIDLDSTCDVLQKELFGTKDIRFEDEVGQGTIPRDCIEFESMSKDGRRLIQCRVKHVDGGYNLVRFYGQAQGQDKLMGQSIKYAWKDEEAPHHSLEFYAQLVTRTLEAKGWVTFTSTPEQGRTPLNVLFEENKTGDLLLKQISWSDCPHITDDMRKQLLAGIPESQRQMRELGLPVIGKGAVFAFTDSELEEDKPHIDPWDKVLWSLDIGDVNDPTVLSLMLEKPDYFEDGDSKYFIYDQWVLGDDENGNNIRSPEHVAKIINTHIYCNAPCIVPHDAQGKSDKAYGKLLKKAGVKVKSKEAHNPAATSSGGWSKDGKKPHEKSIEAGLWFMEDHFKQGKLKVVKTCVEWFKEKNGYFRTGKKGDKAFSGDDHCIDSSRYGFISLLGGRGRRVADVQKGGDTFNYKTPQQYVYE